MNAKDQLMIKDITMLLKVSANKLDKGDGSARCFAEKIRDYLRRKGLTSGLDILREDSEVTHNDQR